MKITVAQKRKMNKLGLEYDDKMTKKEADILIQREVAMRLDAEDFEYDPFETNGLDDVPLFDRSVDYYNGYRFGDD
jgi:hypothetical protein